MKDKILKELREHNRIVKAVINKRTPQIARAANLIIESLRLNGKVVLFGNGGSAADAQHIAAELVGRFLLERKGLPAICLSTNTSILTAVGNDYGFDKVFERQVEALVDPKDVVIGISTSGNSANVIRGIKKAKDNGAKTIALTGGNGGKLESIVDLALIIPSKNTQRIQEGHILVAHIICGIVEKELVKEVLGK